MSYRKRKHPVLKTEREESEDGTDGAQPPQEDVEKPSQGGDDEAVQKKKSDELWARFLSDVGSRPKECTGDAQSRTTHKVNVSQRHRCVRWRKLRIWYLSSSLDWDNKH